MSQFLRVFLPTLVPLVSVSSGVFVCTSMSSAFFTWLEMVRSLIVTFPKRPFLTSLEYLLEILLNKSINIVT